ncbi:MAG: ABC transporter ATP-binding protein [Corynebacterium glucuronolyticum]|nr:ABC transporter ATP-binding protein [Corynebacterium glucuronolyticum]
MYFCLGRACRKSRTAEKVAYTSQSLSVYKELTIKENIHYFARLVGASAEDEKVACDRVQLTDYADRQVRNLSGGQAGRVSLACALVGEPQVLVLDEPTVGLDPLTRNQLWVFFRELAENGRTLLISSHVMDEATRCDSALIKRDGRFLAHEPLTDLMERTSTSGPEEAFLALIEEDRK